MKQNPIFLVTILLTLYQPSFAADENKNTEPLETFLAKGSQQFGISYSIEYYSAQSGQAALLNTKEVTCKTFTNLKEYVDYLKQSVPEAEITIDGDNSKIVNVCDKMLIKQHDYKLNYPIDLQYSGTLRRLPGAIAGKINNDVRWQNFGMIGELGVSSGLDTVIMDVKQKTGRHILSAAIYSAALPGQLWAGWSIITDGKLHTTIQFYKRTTLDRKVKN